MDSGVMVDDQFGRRGSVAVKPDQHPTERGKIAAHRHDPGLIAIANRDPERRGIRSC